jgi:hypothetical protein
MTVAWHRARIANLLCIEIVASGERNIDVVEPDRQRLVLKKPRA